jgi:hypothetical protein
MIKEEETVRPIRSRLVRYVGLMTVAALAVGMLAGPASAKKLTRAQKAKIAKQLRKQIKKNPKAIKSKKFLKRAALVNFKLPVTFVLRTGDVPATPQDESATRNPNSATVNLGASLGQREVNLGGRLAGEITFSDSYDGGALGNVKVDILPSDTKWLETTSIPLVWNPDVWTNSYTRWDGNAVNELIKWGVHTVEEGCGDYDSATSDLSKALPPGNLIFARDYLPIDGGPGLPGYPLNWALDAISPLPGAQNFDPDNTNIPEGFLPNQSGVDTPSWLKANKNVGDPFALGGNPTPFPYSPDSTPDGFSQPPSVSDAVLRTAPLALQVAYPGTSIGNSGDPDAFGSPDGVTGGANLIAGKSGGEANLFGRIPGKNYGIDITATFVTRINSIIRIVDQPLWGRNLIEGEEWPAGVFGCRQVYTGYVNNSIPGVRLTGNLRIAPGVTADGALRIAKATVASDPGSPARFAVAACVAPMASFQDPNLGPGENRPLSDGPPGSYAEYDDNLPSPLAPGTVLAPLNPLLYPDYTGQLSLVSELPVDTSTIRPTPPDRECNTDADRIVKRSGMPIVEEVPNLAPAVPANGYTVTNSGSAISIGADLSVNNVSIDVLIGDRTAPEGQPGTLDPAAVVGNVVNPSIPPLLTPPAKPVFDPLLTSP